MDFPGDWQGDLHLQLAWFHAGSHGSEINVPLGRVPTDDDFREAAEIIAEAGCHVLAMRRDGTWLFAEVASFVPSGE